MRLSRVNATFLGNLKERIVKILVRGKDDVQTSRQVAPHGIDSNPVKDMVAIQAATAIQGETIVLGYINKDMIAEVGELHLFATDDTGAEKIRIKLKADGTAEFGGDTDNLVRYTPLNTELQAFKTAMQAELTKIATGITGVSGAYTPGTLSVDISAAKVEELKSS